MHFTPTLRFTILLWLFSTPIFLPGQGLERLLPPGTTGSSELIIDHLALADGSVIYVTLQSICRVDAAGRQLWCEAQQSNRGVDTLDNRLRVLSSGGLTTNSILPMRESLYSFDGALLSTDEFEITLPSSGERILGMTRMYRTAEDSIHLFIPLIDRNATPALGGFVDRIQHCVLSPERAAVRFSSFSAGDACRLYDVYPIMDGEHAILLGTDLIEDDTVPIVQAPMLVAKVENSGNIIPLDTITADYADDPLMELTQQGRYLLSYRPRNQLATRILEYDFDNLFISREVSLPTPRGQSNPYALRETQEGHFLLLETGINFIPEYGARFLYVRNLDADFSEIDGYTYGLPQIDCFPRALGIFPDGGFYAFGQAFEEELKTFFVRADEEGTTFSHQLVGRLLAGNADCTIDAPEVGLPNWWVRLLPQEEQIDTLYAFTDDNGRFSVRADSGSYLVEALSPNAYWEPCNSEVVSFTGVADSVELSLGVRRVYDCPLLTVTVNTPFLLPRCESYTTRVNYRNQGASMAPNSTLRVIMDPFVDPLSSIPEWNERQGDTLWYNLGSQAVGAEGEIRITTVVDCDEVVVGQAHCTEAKIFPDSLCTPPGINWDGSSLLVSGRCEADSVFFRIENIGVGDMAAPRQYVITEDVVLHFGGQFELQSGRSLELSIPASGATYRLTAEQDPDHPGNSQPSVAVEGCGAESPEDYQTGILGQYPDDDGDPFIDIACRQNVDLNPGSFRETETDEGVIKSRQDAEFMAFVSPDGVGDDHLVDAKTVLRYYWRFENLTSERIDYLRFQNNLAKELEISSLQGVTATIDFTYQVTPTGAVTLSFENAGLAPGEAVEWSYSVAISEEVNPGREIVNVGEISYGGRPYRKAAPAVVTVRKPERYDFFEAPAICTFEVGDLPGLLRQRDTVSFQEYDSITLTLTPTLPAFRVQIDTVIQEGDSLLGRLILMDTELIDSLKTQLGCDSLVSYVVTVDPGTSTRGIDAEEGWTVYPNPATDYLILQSSVSQRVLAITIHDLSGRTVRKVAVPASRLLLGEGLLLSTENLRSGWYLIGVRTMDKYWTSRVFIHRR
jgi:hypothetical protein